MTGVSINRPACPRAYPLDAALILGGQAPGFRTLGERRSVGGATTAHDPEGGERGTGHDGPVSQRRPQLILLSSHALSLLD